MELQQRYFKDLSGGLDQHMRSLTHLLAAGWPRQVPPGGFNCAWGDEYHSWLCGCSDCPTWVHVASLEGEWLTGCPAAKWVNVVCGAPVWDVSFDGLVRALSWVVVRYECLGVRTSVSRLVRSNRCVWSLIIRAGHASAPTVSTRPNFQSLQSAYKWQNSTD